VGVGAWECAPLPFQPPIHPLTPVALSSMPQFSPDGATATASLGGETRAMATVTASLEAPYPDR